MNHTSTFVETEVLSVDRPFRFESGDILPRIDIAYETYGQLNEQRDNAVLIEHALSGDAHAAFYHKGDRKPGWWDCMIGPGKAFDTDRYFVICSNVIGGCRGTSGPSSINPATSRPYGLTFPPISIRDMVEVQRILLKHLGIDRLKCIAGGSMGGMQTPQFFATIRFSSNPLSVSPVHETLRPADRLQRGGQARDHGRLRWNNGNYYDDMPPEGGSRWPG